MTGKAKHTAKSKAKPSPKSIKGKPRPKTGPAKAAIPDEPVSTAPVAEAAPVPAGIG